MGHTVFEFRQDVYYIENKISRPEMLNERVLNALKANQYESLLPLNAEEKKKETILSIGIRGYVPLTDYLPRQLNNQMFFQLVRQLIEIVKSCIANSLNPANLELALQHILVSPQSGELKCIYWPIVNNTRVSSVENFFACLPMVFQFEEGETRDYVNRYVASFDSGDTFSVFNLDRLVQEVIQELSRLNLRNGYENPVPEHRSGDAGAGSTSYDPFATVENTREPVCVENTATPNVNNIAEYAFLLSELTGEAFPVKKPIHTIGRGADCDLAILNSPSVSRMHASIGFRDNMYLLMDQESTEGTYINGTRIEVGKQYQLQNMTKIAFADVEYIFILQMME